MLKRVKISEADIRNLASKIPPLPPENKILDFSNLVVKKPWGNEYLIYANRFVEIWNLNIEEGQSTSLHCHPNKKTGLILLEGEALFSNLSGSLSLKPFDAIVIEAGVFHQTKAISSGGARLIELETPPAKHDLIRLHDVYGREDQAYEGFDKTFPDAGECIRFTEVIDGQSAEKLLGNCKLCIQKMDNKESSSELLDYLPAWDFLVILEGLIYGPRNDEIYGVAEILQARDLLENRDSIRIFNLTLLGLKANQANLTKKIFNTILSKIIQR